MKKTMLTLGAVSLFFGMVLLMVNGCTRINTIPDEMVELLFISLIDVEYNTKSLAIDNIKFLGTCSGIENSKSFYTLLSYGNASKIIGKTIKGDITLKDDIMTETVLGLLLNNKLDENN